jgi:phosphate transport system substrate-binding protein
VRRGQLRYRRFAPVLAVLALVAAPAAAPIAGDSASGGSSGQPSDTVAGSGADVGVGVEVQVDDALRSYAAEARLKGSVRGAGSPVAGMLLQVMSDPFRQFQPDVRVELTLGGTSTGPPALLSGAAQMALMGRRYTDAETSAFRAKFRYPPVEVAIATDAVAVFVHRDNPIESLTIEQLRDVFSQRRRADGARLDHWSELNSATIVTTRPAASGTRTTTHPSPRRPPPAGPIALYGIAADGGESTLFREAILGDEPLSASMRVQLTQSSAVQGIAADASGIGYAAFLYSCRGVRAVPLVSPADGRAYACTAADCRSGRYPLARSLYVYLNKPPSKPLDRPMHEFLRFVLSRDGQRVAVAAGGFPLSPDAANDALEKIGK